MPGARWTSFSPVEYDALAARGAAMMAPLNSGEASSITYEEDVCPACGHRSVRRYYSEYTGLRGTVGMHYAWCGHCRRYASSTGRPLSARDYEFDALPPDVLRSLDRVELPEFLDELDSMWNAGVLPQTIRRRPKPR
jgi:hypothetical protein